MTDEIRPFEVHVPDEVLTDLRDRLRRTRWPDQIEGSGWTYGTDRTYLQEVCATWADDFDWRAWEQRLNHHDQFVTTIDGVDIHFLHERSYADDALPMIMTHGWPGSVLNFLPVIERLTDPVVEGGDPGDAFHLVIPSLPGYGFSGKPNEPGWDVQRIAEAWAVLMDRLGYDRYVAQGGDWGSMVSSRLAAHDPEHCVALHLNLVLGMPTDDEPADPSTTEQAAMADMATYLDEGSGYAKIQGTRPQTLSYALNDSPSGQAAWIVEKFREWTDCDGDLEAAVDRDQLLATITLYWVTETAGSSARLYYESQHADTFGLGPWVEAPTGCAIYPREIMRPPRRWAEQLYHVTRYTELERGGHFPTLEVPDLFVDDVRAFFAEGGPSGARRMD